MISNAFEIQQGKRSKEVKWMQYTYNFNMGILNKKLSIALDLFHLYIYISSYLAIIYLFF